MLEFEIQDLLNQANQAGEQLDEDLLGVLDFYTLTSQSLSKKTESNEELISNIKEYLDENHYDKEAIIERITSENYKISSYTKYCEEDGFHLWRCSIRILLFKDN